MVWSFIQISCINNDIIHLFEDIGWLTKMENLMLNLLKVLILLSASLHFCFKYSSSANLTGFYPLAQGIVGPKATTSSEVYSYTLNISRIFI